jgi:putative SOS response-associated peptidase YedK
MPDHAVRCVVTGDAKRSLVQMRWGIVPAWWKKPLKEMRLATFNVRAETITEKPVFREAFERHRCPIPASSYYEWKATPTGKQPYYFTRRDGEPMAFGGIQDVCGLTPRPVSLCDRAPWSSPTPTPSSPMCMIGCR